MGRSGKGGRGWGGVGTHGAIAMDTFELQRKQLATTRAVVMVLALGIAAFTVVVAVLVSNGGVPAQPSLVAPLGATVGVLGMSLVGMVPLLRRTIVKQTAQKVRANAASDAAGRLLGQGFAAATIGAAAAVEGWGLLGAVTLFLTGWWPAIVAPLVASGIILGLLLPTQERYEAFVREVTGG